MGAFLPSHLGKNKLHPAQTIDPQNLKTALALQGPKQHLACRKVSLASNRHKFFQDFLRKNHHSINFLRLTDPCLDFTELSSQYSQLERNRRNLRTVKQLAIGWWFDPDEVDEGDLYGYDEEDFDDYWEELDDDIDLDGVKPSLTQKKDVFSFLGKHLKDMKDLTRIKIDAISELKKYALALQANLKYLKKVKEISINICEAELNKKDILNLVKALKGARSIESLKLSFQWCNFPEESAFLLLKALPRFGNLKHLKLNFSWSLGLGQKSYELIAKLPACLIGLESFVLNLKRQDFNNNHTKVLVQSLAKNIKLRRYIIILEHCSQISLWNKLKLCQKKGFFVFNCPLPEYC